MLLITCPFCGDRDEHEFSYGGEAHIARPTNSMDMTDAEWAHYVYLRTNTKGIYLERWVHTGGCRKWFNAARNTATNELLCTYKNGEALPKGITPTLQALPKAARKAAAKKPAAAKKSAAPKKTAAKKATAAKTTAAKPRARTKKTGADT